MKNRKLWLMIFEGFATLLNVALFLKHVDSLQAIAFLTLAAMVSFFFYFLLHFKQVQTAGR